MKSFEKDSASLFWPNCLPINRAGGLHCKKVWLVCLTQSIVYKCTLFDEYKNSLLFLCDIYFNVRTVQFHKERLQNNSKKVSTTTEISCFCWWLYKFFFFLVTAEKTINLYRNWKKNIYSANLYCMHKTDKTYNCDAGYWNPSLKVNVLCLLGRVFSVHLSAGSSWLTQLTSMVDFNDRDRVQSKLPGFCLDWMEANFFHSTVTTMGKESELH